MSAGDSCPPMPDEMFGKVKVLARASKNPDQIQLVFLVVDRNVEWMLTVEVLKSDKALTTICECLPMVLREAWKRMCAEVGIEYAEATFAQGEPV